MAPPRWVQQLDAFRSLPTDLAESSASGAAMTFAAVITCSVLFICELSAFISAKPRTDVRLDSNQDSMLRISFDVTMMDMACEHVTVGVWDAFGTERMNITRNMKKQRIDHAGNDKGHPYSEDELDELEFSNVKLSKAQMAELDSDWSSSSDQFKHDNFQSVVEAHDFTFVNFYADWCPHCQQFGPTWTKFEDRLNNGEEPTLDADGNKANLRVLKVNCVEFEEVCQDQHVQSFPTIRLYRRTSSKDHFASYHGHREIEPLVAYAKEEIAKRHLHAGAHFHQVFKEGCRINGHVEVARVPGTLHFQAANLPDRTLNLAYTNVSHTVHSFAFGENSARAKRMLPSEFGANVDPVAGRTFWVNNFHLSPHHYIKVVHTRFDGMTTLRTYQQTHQWSIRKVQKKTIPQAKFSYDLSPVEVIVSKGDRRWYDFITSCLAIIGGAFTVMSMTAGFMNFAGAHLLKASINKLG